MAGLLGTYGLTVSTANVGLVAATGVASRRIAFVVAALLMVAAFQPTFVGILTIMPPPVMASALLFNNRNLIFDRVATLRLPAAYQWPEMAEREAAVSRSSCSVSDNVM